MQSALFVVNVKQRIHQDWETFCQRIEPKLKTETGAMRLDENVWLVDCQQSVRALSWLVALADQLALPYRIGRLDSAPQWLQDGSYPETK